VLPARLAAPLEMTVRFNRLSADSTIFYYLGFQNLMRWTAHDNKLPKSFL
jgi:hypothetical protein